MRRIFLFFLFLLPIRLLVGYQTGDATGKVSIGPVPGWVQDCSFALKPPPLKPSQVHLQYLLTDIQHHAVEKSAYVHFAVRALSASGVNDLSRLDIVYAPSFEKVVVHFIRIFREGRSLDRLESAHFSILQREPDLERNLYRGHLTLVYLLEDVREGDIIEYAYTVEGELPHFSSHLTLYFNLQGGVVFERLYRRLVVASGTDFEYRLYDCSTPPRIAQIDPSLEEWTWELHETPPFPVDEGSPAWHFPLSGVQFSQYASWSEVSHKLSSLYQLPFDLETEASVEMRDLVTRWQLETSSVEQRALLALRFVQDTIRYFGLEEGIGGFKPHDPRQVLQHRYGDCKDKTFLVYALLKMMGIDSTPVLVNSSEGRNLPHWLPSPFSFDHIVLRIAIGDQIYWVDPTFELQGGTSLKRCFIPPYQWGLPVFPESGGLVSISSGLASEPISIDTSLRVVSEESIDMQMTRTFRGGDADDVRRYLDWRGVFSFSEDTLHALQKIYGKASCLAPVILEDDRQSNILTLREHYQIGVNTQGGEKVIKVFSTAIRNYLHTGMNPERRLPFAFAYPAWIKEHLHLENPFSHWVESSNTYTLDHESLFYSHARHVGKKTFDLQIELKHLKDHVPPESSRRYWELSNEIELNCWFFLHLSQ